MRRKGKVFGAIVLSMAMMLTSCGTAPQKSSQNNITKSAESAKVIQTSAEKAESKRQTSTDRVEKVRKENAKNDAKVKLKTSFIKGNAKVKSAKTKEEKSDIVETLLDKHFTEQKNEEKTSVNNENVAEDGSLKKPFDQVYPEIFESDQVEYADNTILIKMDRSFDGKVDSELKKAGIGKLELMFDMEKYSWYTAYLYKGKDVNKVMEKVRKLKEVVVAEYNFKAETTSVDDTLISEVQDNPKVDQQELLKSCGLQKAWRLDALGKMLSGGSRDVTVAVIDTGVDYNHKDLKTNIWTNTGETPNNGIDDDGDGYVDDYYGADITAGQGSGMDDQGHGTHVAGIIGAANNKEGIVGIAYNTKIMPVKAGDASGYFAQDNIAKAIIYAYDHGADVINMSFGGSAASIAVQDALATAYTRCVLIASAGNDGKPNEATDNYPVASPSYPAALSYVVGVMSCSYIGVESSFTNWDVELFNNVEYEVYAPGEQVISTLPNDKYGKLSGTSMAAPVVAAQAALLRSYYSDPEKYPTKFIYGQIVGTTENTVKCNNPGKHTINGKLHNCPGMVNFYNSLTKLPTPDVGAMDYRIFDTAGFSADKEGITAGCEEVNNGDGVIDAGETVAFGFNLRNRWGMSKDTVVHIDAKSSAGVDCPYIEILNNDINYGSVGTYSEQDCGKLYDESGDKWNGWEKPFYLKVKDNCPNGYTIQINVTVTCKNALNEKDTTEYQTKSKYMIEVRKGTILPNKITEDTTLTNDKCYIIPNSMIVMKGATLTIEKGTHIQFWCSDPSDSYADTAITYLKVEGKLITKGTEEEPVVMEPSKWMDRYRVEVYTSDNGYAELNYTNITNPYITVDKAVNCEFTQNYKGTIFRRYLDGGKVETASNAGQCQITEAVNCSFYKVGSDRSYYPFLINGNLYDGCIFVDSNIEYDSSCKYKNCVFYGNNNYNGESSGGTSSLVISSNGYSTIAVDKIFRNNETGTTYVILDMPTLGYVSCSESKNYYENTVEPLRNFARCLEGSYVIFDTQKEFNYISSMINGRLNYGNSINCDITKDDITGEWVDTNGNPILSSLPMQEEENSKAELAIWEDGKLITEGGTGNHLLEIPGDVYITDITFPEYVVDIDTDTTYQINASLEPATAQDSSLKYESEDESVAKVDKNGVVTPVAQGTTNIRVYSPDMAVSNYVTINVKDAVDLTALKLSAPEDKVEVGESIKLSTKLTPANTTKRQLTYQSSDEEIATVSDRGVVTFHKKGKVDITVKGAHDLTDRVTLRGVVSPKSLTFEDSVYATTLDKDDKTEFYPVISPANADIDGWEWNSSDDSVCYVDEKGSLIKKKEGVVTLRAKLKDTSLQADIDVVVSNEKDSKIIKMGQDDDYYFALREDGTLWYWGNGIKIPQKLNLPVMKDFIICRYSSSAYILDENGTVSRYNYFTGVKDSSFSSLKNVISFQSNNYNENSYFALTNSGVVYAWGRNDYGNLGIGDGDISSCSSPSIVDLDAAVKKIVTNYYGTLFLTEKKEVYYAGGSGRNKAEPVLLSEGAEDIYADMSNSSYSYIDFANSVQRVDSQMSLSSLSKEVSSQKYYNGSYYYYIQDGVRKGEQCHNQYGQAGDGSQNNNTWFYYTTKRLTTVTDCYPFENNHFLLTEDGSLYATGEAVGSGTGADADVTIPQKVPFVSLSEKPLTLTDWSGYEEEGTTIVSDSEMVLNYNASLDKGGSYSKITLEDSQGIVQPITKTVEMNRLVLKARSGLTEGETYTLTIPSGALQAKYIYTTNEETKFTFTYHASKSEDEVVSGGAVSGGTASNETASVETPAEEDSETPKEEVVHKAQVDEDKLAQRKTITSEEVQAKWKEFFEAGGTSTFHSNVILNRLSDDKTENWLRITAPESSSYSTIYLGKNYWGTTNKELINKQILDFDDYQSLADIVEGEQLAEAPTNTYPFVVDAYLKVNDKKTTTVGNDLVTFVVEFSRDMNQNIKLKVNFGSAYPYADYEVEGKYVSPRKWEGSVQLNTLIENGYQYWSVSNGKAAGTSLKLFKDWGRFPFKIDTSSAQSLLMQGSAEKDGIHLSWTQDDFETLAGYNVYRSDKEDGRYEKINKTVIDADTKEFVDMNVVPGQKYYYNFTVVQSDMKESEPSGKVDIMALDTMAPDIYHNPVFNAFTGSNLIISATITDNVAVTQAKLYYRVKGTDEWKSVVMTHQNDKYSAMIASQYVTTEGLEYYIEATDGNEVTRKGSAEDPFEIAIQEALDENSLGDVDGNGVIELKDAIMLLMAINDRINLTPEEFSRADLDKNGSLAAKEALRIMQYVNGTITTIAY